MHRYMYTKKTRSEKYCKTIQGLSSQKKILSIAICHLPIFLTAKPLCLAFVTVLKKGIDSFQVGRGTISALCRHTGNTRIIMCPHTCLPQMLLSQTDFLKLKMFGTSELQFYHYMGIHSQCKLIGLL